jgi:GTP pyrophosphokinase
VTTSADTRAEEIEAHILSRISRPPSTAKGQVLVVGVDRMLTALARCCKPAPPDLIKGFVTKGRGVSVHRADCQTLARMLQHAPERLIQTEWGPQTAAGDQAARYLVDITVVGQARPDLLRDIAEILAREKIPLVRLDSFPKGETVTLSATVQVINGAQLSKALLMLQDISGVSTASRTSS